MQLLATHTDDAVQDFLMKPTLQEILCTGHEEFERTHPLSRYVRMAARAIINCRTPMMGGYIERCPKGDFQRTFFHSCRYRVCPKSSYMKIEQWLVNKKALMLNYIHYYVIFTIPNSLNDVWPLNVKLKFFKDCLPEWVVPGAVISIQTWGDKAFIPTSILFRDKVFTML